MPCTSGSGSDNDDPTRESAHAKSMRRVNASELAHYVILPWQGPSPSHDLEGTISRTIVSCKELGYDSTPRGCSDVIGAWRTHRHCEQVRKFGETASNGRGHVEIVRLHGHKIMTTQHHFVGSSRSHVYC
jgi:hypothetical protein